MRVQPIHIFPNLSIFSTSPQPAWANSLILITASHCIVLVQKLLNVCLSTICSVLILCHLVCVCLHHVNFVNMFPVSFYVIMYFLRQRIHWMHAWLLQFEIVFKTIQDPSLYWHGRLKLENVFNQNDWAGDCWAACWNRWATGSQEVMPCLYSNWRIWLINELQVLWIFRYNVFMTSYYMDTSL